MIRFYNNTASRLYNDPSIFSSGIKCRFHSESYEFLSLHSALDITHGSSPLIDIINPVINNDDGFITFYCDDIEFGGDNIIQDGNNLTGLVFYESNGTPLFYLNDIVGLPATALGERVVISISKGRNGLFSINGDYEHMSGSHYATVFKPFTGFDLPTNIKHRSGADIHPVEAQGKKSLTGKRGTYKDLSMFGSAHPITGDIATIIDEHAISQSLRTILLTDTGERPFSSMKIAGNINAWLFETIDFGTIPAIESSIKASINNFEPRIILRNVTASMLPEQNAVKIIIVYDIKATSEKHTFNLLLNRA